MTDQIKQEIANRLASIASTARLDRPTTEEAVTMTRAPSDQTLAILLPVLILLSSLLFLLLIFLIFIILARRRKGIQLQGDDDGPLDLGREEELEGEGAMDGLEARWLASQEEPVKAGYARAKGPYRSLSAVRHSAYPLRNLNQMDSLANSISSQFATYRHHSVPIPVDSRKGRVCLVF